MSTLEEQRSVGELSSITGTLSVDDHINCQRYMRRHFRFRKLYLCSLAIVIGITLIGFGYIFHLDFGFIVGCAITGGGAWVVIVDLKLNYIDIPRASQRIYDQDKIRTEETYYWNSAFLQVESTVLNAKIPWNSLYSVEEDDSLFLLYSTESHAFIISKRWFQSKKAEAEFRRVARSRDLRNIRRA